MDEPLNWRSARRLSAAQAHGDRLPAYLCGKVPLLNSRIERVHVDVDDSPVLLPGPRPSAEGVYACAVRLAVGSVIAHRSVLNEYFRRVATSEHGRLDVCGR